MIGWDENVDANDRRLAALLAWLINARGPVSMGELARSVGGYPSAAEQVEEAVREDTAELAVYGLEVVWSDHGGEPVVSLAATDWEPRPLALEDDARGILDEAIELSRPWDADLAEGVRALAEQPDVAQSVTVSLSPRTSAGPDRAAVYSRLHRLAGQMAAGVVAGFRYADSLGQLVTRQLRVYGLGESRGVWYAVGAEPSSNSIIAFKVAEMHGPVADASQPGAYSVPADFEVSEHLALPWRLGPDPFSAEVRFDRDLAPFIVTSLPHVRMTQHDDGSVQAMLAVGDLEKFVGWVLTYGTHARILSPPLAVDRIVSCLEGMVSANG